ncbi:hypothetical protein SH1V18_21690 [Vallitalea longa]|uniref:DUF1468 domain-containing protein n=1 Tax=Vallitalea longa TaxID=2936439 RepID=A0A9W6DGF5_9FIRM|nr:tripartite tricarboxylate transporter TctB family protein [Vallitalea longa]GKX29689.1 hypothetical protein SH1V18_21690 [Vallitalea longa]
MKIKIKQELVGAILFFTVAAVIWFLIPSQIAVKGNEQISSQTFPRLIIGLMGLCSGFIIIKEIVKIIKKQPVKEIEINLREERKSLAVILMLLGYWLLLHVLPFMLVSLIFGGVMLVFFKCKNWKYYVTVSVIIIAVTLVFQNALNVELP